MNMKRILPLVLMFAMAVAMAKTTYIPSYQGALSITKDGQTTTKNDCLREVTLGYDNGHVVFTLLHEEVTKSKVKSIKRAKMGAGWAAVGWGMAMGYQILIVTT